jgi:hypothetical protein
LRKALLITGLSGFRRSAAFVVTFAVSFALTRTHTGPIRLKSIRSGSELVVRKDAKGRFGVEEKVRV